jgi:phosphoglycerate dehydrogenase-like enzyme
MTPNPTINIAVLDDYQAAALSSADWTPVQARARDDVFHDHLSDPDAVVERLLPYDIVCVMRERTPLRRDVLARLPRLKLICSTAKRNASIDTAAAAERGIEIAHTSYISAPTIEHTWALILGSARHLVAENASLRAGGWQTRIGDDLAGRTLGVIGLGNVGSQVAKVAVAFGMNVIAWSQNLTDATVHLVLSARTVGLIGAAELALMKPTARIVNTSRGPIVVEFALIAALTERRIAGAALDVFDTEPLPPDHPYRRIDNLLATPHIGYVSRGLYERFYGDTVANITGWLDGRGST